MDFKTVPLIISQEVTEIMENRGIKESDVREVIEYGETTSRKLVSDDGVFLAKKRVNNFTPNVEYAIQDGGIEIRNLYSYIISFVNSED